MAMSTLILVTGVINLDPTKHDDAVAAMGVCMEATRQEEGCERYTFSADLSDPGCFHVSEQWASAEAMDTHMASAHMATFLGQMGALGVTGASLTKWDGATSSKLM